jgi:hypothetical protein
MPDPVTLPRIATEPVSVVLLAHDETARRAASEVVEKWIACLDRLERDYEILVAEDASLDPAGTPTSSHPRVRFLHEPTRRGPSACLRIGLAAARHPLLFYTECDRHQYQPGDFKRLLDEIDKVHLVSGYRKWQPLPRWLARLGGVYRSLVRLAFGDRPPPLPGWLGWKEHLSCWVVRLLFGVRLRDVYCAYRLCRRAIFDRIPIQSDGSFVHVEVVAKANFLGHYLNDEVTVNYRPRHPGDKTQASTWRQTLRDGWRVLAHADFGPALLPSKETSAPAAPGG